MKKLGPITAIAGIVLVVGTVQLFAGALSVGVTTDEPTQLDRTSAWLSSGWYVPGDYLSDGRPNPDIDASNPYVYGPAFAAVAHAANVVANKEPRVGVSDSSGAYAVRHLVVAALGLLTAALVGMLTATLTRSRRFGLWAAAGLLAVPVWMGHAFFNVKDVPAATGYTLVTAALVLALSDVSRRSSSTRRQVWLGLLMATGVGLGVGTRLPLWVPFGASVLAYAALRFGQWRYGGVAGGRRTDLAIGAGALAGLAAIAALYPKIATAPVKFLTESVSGSADYPYYGLTLTAGHLLPARPPWWYLPAWLSASYPVLLALLAVGGAVFGVYMLLRRDERGGRSPWRRPQLGLALVLIQAALLPAAGITGNAVMYSGLRQHLYIVPAAAVLAGFGAWWVWGWAASRDVRAWKAVVGVAISAALLVPMTEQLLLFPYNYAYVNPPAGTGGVNNHWETDYWFASAPEALARVPRGVKLECSYFLTPPEEPDLERCDGKQLAPFADRRGTEATAAPSSNDSDIWVIARKRGGNRPPAYCQEVDDVTRWLRGEEVVMAYVLRCDPRRAPKGTF